MLKNNYSPDMWKVFLETSWIVNVSVRCSTGLAISKLIWESTSNILSILSHDAYGVLTFNHCYQTPATILLDQVNYVL